MSNRFVLVPLFLTICSQVYVERIEGQLGGMDTMEIRATVDTAYEKITQTMFDCLQQMAKMDNSATEGQLSEDKGMLNYHVIMIGEC